MIGELDLTERAEQLEAFETDPWAAKAILRHELLTLDVVEPNCGTGILTQAARAEGYTVHTADIFDWSKFLPCEQPQHIGDWTNRLEPPAPFMKKLIGKKWTAFMNPPFQLACEFVDRAMELDAYKIISFQRFAWRESGERDEWWEKNPPARIWLCRDRANCYRFDIPHRCLNTSICENQVAKKPKTPGFRCRECMSGTTQAHAFYVWERGHKGAEILNILRKP